jgi:hypothetical protein
MSDGKIDVYLGTKGYAEVSYREKGDGSVIVTDVRSPVPGVAGAYEGQEFKSAEALNRACNGLLATPLKHTRQDW